MSRIVILKVYLKLRVDTPKKFYPILQFIIIMFQRSKDYLDKYHVYVILSRYNYVTGLLAIRDQIQP